MIKRISIRGYKSFLDLDLELKPLSVIFGPNASGKSNLLDAIHLLSRMVTSKNLKEAFDGHRGLPLESFYYAKDGYENLLKNPSVCFRFEVEVELSKETKEDVTRIVLEKRRGWEVGSGRPGISLERFLRYTLEVEAAPATGYLRVTDERLAALRPDGKEKKSRRPFFERVRWDKQERIHLRMEGQARPTYPEIGLDHTIISMALYEPHYPHITAFRQELEKWRIYYLEPRTIMREEVPISEVESLGPRGENVAPFLNILRQQREKDFESFQLTLRQVLPSVTSVDIERSKVGLLGLVLSENGVTYSARLISEGTLRLLGLLAAIHPANNATVIGFEEPENGVHPVRLKLVADLLKKTAGSGKQIIITTHSPRLPRYFDDKSLFVCRKEVGETKINKFKSLGPLFRKGEVEQALEERIVRGDFGG